MKIFIISLLMMSNCFADALFEKYEYSLNNPSDISEHLPILRDLSRECSSVTEIGLRSMVSTWGILQGLSESPFSTRTYIGIDIASPSLENLQCAQNLSQEYNIHFIFWLANDFHITIFPTDLLFIDSLHTYAHLTYELEKFSPYVKKYIAMHDTSDPWGSADDTEYHGNYSEYPCFIDREKRGLWLAVTDFLANHPEWTLKERKLNCYGFTILERVSD